MYKDFFKTIDTEEKAYWLGFIASDGNIRKDLLECSITVQESDSNHLKKFSKCFEDYYTVKHYNYSYSYPIAKISIYSKQCCLDLEKYGIIPNKSLSLKVNKELIPNNLLKDFIRGYFDGNGSIYRSTLNRNSGYNYEEWGCNFVGSYEMILLIKDFFKSNNPIIKRKAVFSIDWGGTLSTYEVLKKLYENSTIFLDRKKEKFLELQSSQRLNKLVSRRDYFAEEKNTSILVGFVMGGASIRFLTATKQSKEKEKLKKIAEIFKKYNYEYELVEDSCVKDGYILRVRLSPDVAKNYRHSFYPNGNKTVTRHLLNELNDDGLFIWFLLKSKNKDHGLQLETSRLTDDEINIIYNYFTNNHKVDVSFHRRKGKKIIYFPKKTKEYFFRKFMFQGAPV